MEDPGQKKKSGKIKKKKLTHWTSKIKQQLFYETKSKKDGSQPR